MFGVVVSSSHPFTDHAKRDNEREQDNRNAAGDKKEHQEYAPEGLKAMGEQIHVHAPNHTPEGGGRASGKIVAWHNE